MMNLKYLNSTLKNLDNCFAPKDPQMSELRLLDVNLSMESCTVREIPFEWLNAYTGGPALGMRIWADNVNEVESNPVVILAGSLVSSGFSDTDIITIVFKSPQNGQITSHTVKTGFAYRLKECGFHGVILSGRARRYCHVEISKHGASVLLTEQFTHLRVSQISSLFAYKDVSLIMTGPACEASLPYSCAVIDGKSSGRGGLGLVLENKNVRVVSVNSELYCPEERKSLLDDALEKGELCKIIENYGSYYFVEKAFRRGWAAVENYSGRTDPRMFHITPLEVMRRIGDAFDGDIPWEVIIALGPNCGCFDICTIIFRYKLCIDLGLDPISMGNLAGQLNMEIDDFEDLAVKASSGELKIPESWFEINGLECGGIDFRGAIACGLNASLGNSFPVLFDIGFGASFKEPWVWVAFNEDLVFGLESSGLSCARFIPAFWDSLGKFKQSFVKCFPKGLYRLEKSAILESMGLEFKKVLESGQRCWRLKKEINEALGCKKPMLPDFFCVNPKSNYNKESIVPLFSLLQRYSKFREAVVVSQLSKANNSL